MSGPHGPVVSEPLPTPLPPPHPPPADSQSVSEKSLAQPVETSKPPWFHASWALCIWVWGTVCISVLFLVPLGGGGRSALFTAAHFAPPGLGGPCLKVASGDGLSYQNAACVSLSPVPLWPSNDLSLLLAEGHSGGLSPQSRCGSAIKACSGMDPTWPHWPGWPGRLCLAELSLLV